MEKNSIVYLNGQFLPIDEAKVSVLDRGFVFGDGIYEVIPVYSGRLFRLEHHLERLDRSLEGIRLSNPLVPDEWSEILHELVTKNGRSDQSIYLQITRGVAKRDHAFPVNVEPTIFAMSNPMGEVDPELRKGVTAVTVEDFRWKLCHIKSIALLPNILLRQQAIDQGAVEAIMLRDGQVTEGAATNVFIVHNNTVITPPKSNLLLPGITRDLVVELCNKHAIACEERDISEAELRSADEVWLSSSTKEVIPVTTLDGKPVGVGQPGPVWENILALYQEYKKAVRAGKEQ
jgi:D-alanine transaminase